MGRQNIYSTLGVASAMPVSMIEDLSDFLITNRNFILPAEKRTEAFKSRFTNHSLLSDIVHRLVVLGKDQAYSLFRLPTKTVSVREAIDMTFVPIDFLQIKEMTPQRSKTLSLIPELDNKLVINVTDITKSNGDFNDVTQFYYRVVRDFLSRSFYISTGNVWISPTLVRYVAKVYSMTIGGQIARLFGLSPLVQMFIQTVFCTYIVGKMTSDEVTPMFLKTHGRHMGLPESADLHQIMSFIEDTLGKSVPGSLEEVCKVIDAYDHDQLRGTHGSKLTRPILNMKFANLSPDPNVGTIALEYPPYFMFLIILVLSGIPIGLSYPMKNLNLLKEGKEVFEQLTKSAAFLNIS